MPSCYAIIGADIGARFIDITLPIDYAIRATLSYYAICRRHYIAYARTLLRHYFAMLMLLAPPYAAAIYAYIRHTLLRYADMLLLLRHIHIYLRATYYYAITYAIYAMIREYFSLIMIYATHSATYDAMMAYHSMAGHMAAFYIEGAAIRHFAFICFSLIDAATTPPASPPSPRQPLMFHASPIIISPLHAAIYTLMP